jgi:hypothetical protein
MNYSTGYGYGQNPYAKDPMAANQFSMFPENPGYDPKQNMSDVAPIPMQAGGESSSPAPGGMAPAAKGSQAPKAQGDNADDMAGNGLISSGNPYAMAAGTALKVIAAEQKRKEAQMKEAQMLAVEKMDRQQNALSRLMNIAQGLKQL